jgi:hypothetical protein
MVTTARLTLLSPEACNLIVIHQVEREYLVFYGWCVASETDLLTGLQELPFDIVDAGYMKTQRSTQIRNVTCFARNMTNSLWKFLSHRSFKLNNGISIAMKVTLPPPPGAMPSFYREGGYIQPELQ